MNGFNLGVSGEGRGMVAGREDLPQERVAGIPDGQRSFGAVGWELRLCACAGEWQGSAAQEGWMTRKWNTVRHMLQSTTRRTTVASRATVEGCRPAEL